MQNIDQVDNELLPSIQHQIHLDLAKFPCLKELTSPYIVSYLHFLNSNNILTLSKLLSVLNLRLI